MGSKNSRRGKVSQKTITRRGLRMCQKDGQIKALSGDRWDVASQSVNNEWYRISMSLEGPTCECKYHVVLGNDTQYFFQRPMTARRE